MKGWKDILTLHVLRYIEIYFILPLKFLLVQIESWQPNMCGIIGLQQARLQLLVKSIISSFNIIGPDDPCYYYNDELFLGHKRLSIVDLSPNDHTRMIAEEGNYILIYNGEYMLGL